jgi:hypothetical protein
MAKKIISYLQQQKKVHYLLTFVMFGSLMGLIFLGLGGSSAYAIDCPGTLLCNYNTSNYTSSNGVDNTWMYPESGTVGGSGSNTDPYLINVGQTVNIGVAFNSSESSSGLGVFNWTNIDYNNGSDLFSSESVSGGAAGHYFNNQCVDMTFTTDSPYYNPAVATSYGGSINCDGYAPCYYSPSNTNDPYAGNQNINEPGCNNTRSTPLIPGVPPPYPYPAPKPGGFAANSHGDLAAFYDPSYTPGGARTYTISLKTANLGSFCMRDHVALDTSGSGWATDANILAARMRDVRGISSYKAGNAGAMCFLIQSVGTTHYPSVGYSDTETCSSTNITDGGWQVGQPASTLQSLYNTYVGGGLTLSTAGWTAGTPPDTDHYTPGSAPKAGEYTFTVANVYNGDSASGAPIATSSNIGAPGGESGSISYTPGAPDITITLTHYTILEAHERTASGGAQYMTFSYDNPAPGETYHLNCYHAQCSFSVPGDVPGGYSSGSPASQPAAVLAGTSFIANVSVASTGELPLPGSMGGSSLTLNNSGSPNLSYSNISWPSTDVDATLTYNAPGIGTATLSVYPTYGSTVVGPPCTATVKIYQPFTLDPNPVANFDGDAENPTDVYYTTSVTNSSPTPPDQVPVRASYSSALYFTPSGSSSKVTDDTYGTTSFDFGTGTEFNHRIWNFNNVNQTDKPFVAGNTYCAWILNLPYTQGWVGPGGPTDLLGTSGGGNFKNCATIVNKPYFKVYGSGALTGGSFPTAPASTPPDGLLANWNNDSGLYPNYDFGGGSELANIANGNINGYASAQQSAGDTRSPLDLSFANQPPASIAERKPYSPLLGGSLNGPLYLQDENPGSSTTWSSSSSLPTTTGSYIYNGGSLHITGSTTIGAGQNVYLLVKGDVQIDGNVTYGGGWNIDATTGTSNVPSFIIKATGNIYINPNVGKLDGLYEAQPIGGSKGTIYTCGIDFAPMNKNTLFSGCNQQLTVSGSFNAEQVNLMRTYGTLRDETPVYTPPSLSVAFNRYWCGPDPSGSVLGIHFYQNTGNDQPPLPPACTTSELNPGGLGYIVPDRSGSCDTPGAVPLWWAPDPTDGNNGNFYTTNTAEPHSTIVGCVPPGSAANTEPVYRLYDTKNGGHHYTITQAEAQYIIAHPSTYPNVVSEGIAFYVYDSAGLPAPTAGTSMPLDWSHAGNISGETCIATNEPSEPNGLGYTGPAHANNTWDDNYLCVPPGDTGVGVGKVKLSWSCNNFSGINPFGCNSGNHSLTPDCTDKIGPLIEAAPWNYPSNYTWDDNQICSNYPIQFVATTGSPYATSQKLSDGTPINSSTSYCTPIDEPADISGSKDLNGSYIWTPGNGGQGDAYICIQRTTSPVVTPPPTPPTSLNCENNGGQNSPRPTCAAEVFDYSPEFNLSSVQTKESNHSANSAIDIYNLPPVL